MAVNSAALKRHVLALGLILLAGAARGQAAVDAAEQLRRLDERDRIQRERNQVEPEVHLDGRQGGERRHLPEQESPCFPITRIDLVGELADKFQWALDRAGAGDDPVLGRCLGGEGINIVMSRIQDAIIARGYVTTRVLAAPQDLRQGVLTLTLVPGRIRAIDTRDSDSRVRLSNALPAAPGDLLDLRAVEQGLENLKRVPSADADIQIEPAGEGGRPGESDLAVTWRQAFPLRLNLGLDDAGSKTTGKYQGNATLSVDDALTLNDLFYLTWNQDLGGGDGGKRDTHGFTTHYSLPWDYWLIGFTAGRNRYRQSVAGANQTYLYAGESGNAEIKASRVVYRDGSRKTSLSFKGWLRDSRNFIDDTEVQVQRRRMAGWEAGVSHRDRIGDASIDLDLAYRRGTGAFGSLPAPEEAFGEGTSHPSFFTAAGQLNLPFVLAGQALRYSAAWRAQWNRSPLVPQDRFAIGGRYTVRGFDGENVLSAERGWTLRNDLSLPFAGGGQEIYLGLDAGEVSGPSSRDLVGKRLVGDAVGWRGSVRSVSWDVFWSSPLQKPKAFTTSSTTVGFSLNWSL